MIKRINPNLKSFLLLYIALDLYCSFRWLPLLNDNWTYAMFVVLFIFTFFTVWRFHLIKEIVYSRQEVCFLLKCLLLYVFGFFLFVEFLYVSWVEIFQHKRQILLQWGMASPPLFIYSAVFTLVTAPIIEEVMYRMLLQKYLYTKMKSIWLVIIISSLMYSISHYDLAKIPVTFIPGLLYGWIYYKSKKIWTCISCHFLWNLMSITFDKSYVNITMPFILLYTLGVLLFMLLMKNTFNIKLTKSGKTQEE